MRRLYILGVFVCMLFHTQSLHASEPSVVISEFLPNPVGDDAVGEWVELHNSGFNAISLNGWVLSDVYGTVENYALHGKQIDAGGYLLIYRSESQITLNNDTEQVVLTNAEGLVSSSAIATNPVEGRSYAYVRGEWIASAPTPGMPNVEVTPSPQPTTTPTPTPLPTPTPATGTVQNLQLSEVLACGSATEWVEIFNPNPIQIFLDGWKIQDATTQVKSLEGLSIPPEGYVVKEWSGYFLNNAGDEVRLFHGDDLVDSFTYETCSDGFSWVKHEEIWERTSQITRGGANVFVGSNVGTPLPSPSPTATPMSIVVSNDSESMTKTAVVPKIQENAFVLPVTERSEEEHTDFPKPVKTIVQDAGQHNQSVPKHNTSVWFVSAGCWMWSAACVFLKNATIKHAFTHP